MKKKTIEKIPYLTLPKVSRKKNVKYVGVTAVKNVGHERHFFLEVYRNMKKAEAEPVVRIVLTKKDFGTYWPKDGTWTRSKVTTQDYTLRCIWEDKSHRTWEEQEKENVLYQTEDLERIKKFFADIKIWKEDRWWDYIEKHQDHIVRTERNEQNRRKYERRQQALNDRIKNTPELPEAEILEHADKRYFSRKHYLYYKKRGCWAQIACSKCGGVTEARWKDGISYKSQFQKWTDEPKAGQAGKCLLCGEIGEWKCQGKVKSAFSKSIHLFLGHRYKETGFVMRYIEVSKEWQLELTAGKDGPEMLGACEELSGIEVARAYFEEGKPVQIDYNKHDFWKGEDFWDDCNLYGNANIQIKSAPIMWQTYPEMKGTFLQYSALREYEAVVDEVNPIDYLERYQHTPQIEMLVKLNLIGVVKELVRYRYGIVVNIDANRPDEFLGIRKERVKQIMEKKGSVDFLEVMQMEKRMKQVWTDEQICHIKEIGIKRGQIETTLHYMSIQQLLNRVKKYAGCEYGTGCPNAEARIRHIALTYMDYLSMRQDLGYDLNNTVYQQPRNLEAAHQKMVMESSQKELDTRLLEVKEKFPDIRKNYRKLRNRFFYEDEKLFIRPARSAEEIIMEGRLLHHCVGRDDYLEKHNVGETYILMVRDQKDPELPYITVEIDAKLERIIQWYGANDKKPDKDNMQKWLDNYITRLRCGALAAGSTAGQPEVQQILQSAM